MSVSLFKILWTYKKCNKGVQFLFFILSVTRLKFFYTSVHEYCLLKCAGALRIFFVSFEFKAARSKIKTFYIAFWILKLYICYVLHDAKPFVVRNYMNKESFTSNLFLFLAEGDLLPFIVISLISTHQF